MNKDWLCVKCGEVLGTIVGGELHPAPGCPTRTAGPNLIVQCPACNASKVFYTSDPVVRAVYQLVDAVATVAAKSMMAEIGRAVHQKEPPK